MNFRFTLKRERDSLGIDIGTSAVKIVHLRLKEKEKPELVNFAVARIKNGLIQSRNQVLAGKKISKVLSLALKESDIKNYRTSFSIPSFASFISFVVIPKDYENDLQSKLEIEARKFIPVPLSEVTLGWEIINNNHKEKSMEVKSKEEKIKILLMAVAKDTINKYETIAKECRLNLGTIEVESFSLMRSLGGDEKKTTLILDIGSRICNILITSNGLLKGNRNIDVGGGNLTEAISRGLGVDFKRSESLKKELGINDPQVFDLAMPIVGRVVQEVRRVVDTYNKKNTPDKVEKIIVSGGTAKLNGFKEYMKESLKIEVEEGDPWKKINFDKKYETVIRSFQHELSAAIGSAMNSN